MPLNMCQRDRESVEGVPGACGGALATQFEPAAVRRRGTKTAFAPCRAQSCSLPVDRFGPLPNSGSACRAVWQKTRGSPLADHSLGRQLRVELRTVWTNDPADFAPRLGTCVAHSVPELDFRKDGFVDHAGGLPSWEYCDAAHGCPSARLRTATATRSRARIRVPAQAVSGLPRPPSRTYRGRGAGYPAPLPRYVADQSGQFSRPGA